MNIRDGLHRPARAGCRIHGLAAPPRLAERLLPAKTRVRAGPAAHNKGQRRLGIETQKKAKREFNDRLGSPTLPCAYSVNFAPRAARVGARWQAAPTNTSAAWRRRAASRGAQLKLREGNFADAGRVNDQ